jgi:hypothetical protein
MSKRRGALTEQPSERVEVITVGEDVEADSAQADDSNMTIGLDCNLYIEYGTIRITAGVRHPVQSLAALLREMCAVCWHLKEDASI